MPSSPQVAICTLFILSALFVFAVESKPSDLFVRSPKWTHLVPAGGSLVSGRGNFRPGFVSRAADTRMFLSEPLLTLKRSRPVYDTMNS
ncbi:unnamed protein product [Anisakis simplex]|uniref:Secreted protein n=1 Tax=Anisakis simplex TaxID=6269 RepID=A0A0M3JRS7_ANISI|nr:unnamed protein product [Anisakis simplex]